MIASERAKRSWVSKGTIVIVLVYYAHTDAELTLLNEMLGNHWVCLVAVLVFWMVALSLARLHMLRLWTLHWRCHVLILWTLPLYIENGNRLQTN